MQRKGGHKLPSVDVLRLENHEVLRVWRTQMGEAKRYVQAVVRHTFFDRTFYSAEQFQIWPRTLFMSAEPFATEAAAAKAARFGSLALDEMSFLPPGIRAHQDAKQLLTEFAGGSSPFQVPDPLDMMPRPRERADNSRIETMDSSHFAKAFAGRVKP